MQSSAQLPQGLADEFAGGFGGVETGEGFLRLGGFVAEGQQGEEGVLGISGERGGRGFGRGAAGEGVEGRKLVAQFEDDPFGGFFAETFEFGQRGGVARGDGVPDGLRGGAGEDGEGGLGSHARDVMEKKTKEIPFPRGKEAVEGVVVLADGEMGEEADFFAHFGEAVVGGDGNVDLVADSLSTNDRAGGPGFRQRAFDKRDHVRKLPRRSGR